MSKSALFICNVSTEVASVTAGPDTRVANFTHAAMKSCLPGIVMRIVHLRVGTVTGVRGVIVLRRLASARAVSSSSRW